MLLQVNFSAVYLVVIRILALIEIYINTYTNLEGAATWGKSGPVEKVIYVELQHEPNENADGSSRIENCGDGNTRVYSILA